MALPPASGSSDPAAPAFSSSKSCAGCHLEVYEEWSRSQHAIAFTNPVDRLQEMTDGFRKRDCVPCHAPRPVFEHGLGKASRVVAREANRFEGVDCLTCHLAGKGVASSHSGLSGPCNPVFRKELASTDLCAPCHNQHNTVDEWEQSPLELRGENCGGCHMPEVVRASGPGRPGRYHGPRGGNDLELLQSAATLTWSVVESPTGPRLRVSITNSGTAHNLPADAKHRAIDLVLRLKDREGRAVGPQANQGPGQIGGAARLRFRNPYRTETELENTQIPSGETRTLEVALDLESVRSASILLLYKRTPYVSDGEATVVEHVSITF
ncbi:MAG: multiheme c-type cytochrome [Planctomycetota bacterium]